MSSVGLFLKQVLKNPKEVSAVVPSSKALATCMAKSIPVGAGSVVEFGPGTGVITRAIIEAGVPAEDVHSFEVNDKFVAHLRQIFPAVNVIQDWAQTLGDHGIKDIKAVVSGLPLLSMDISTQREIVGAAFKALRPGGVYIQFTYGLSPSIGAPVIEELNLGWTRSKRIWGNLPPATSYTFYRKDSA